MVMFRSIATIVSLFLVVATTVSCDEPASSPSLHGGDKCSDLDDALVQCILRVDDPNADYDGDFSEVDYTACGQCHAEFYEVSEILTCEEATAKVCEYFDECGRLCFPKQTICVEENSHFQTCSFGKHISPPDCIIQCDGAVLDGREVRKRGGGSNNDNKRDDGSNYDNKKDKVSGATSTSVITVSGMISMMLVVVGFA